MEKLQAALQKARARRETRPEESVARSTPVRRAQSGSSRHRWEELKEIALSGQALTHHRIVTQVASEEAAPFDILRTKVLFQMRQNGWKRLAITSPMPKSGKTTAACNLALGLGRQSGLNSMLFDLDLKDPSVNNFLGYSSTAPISDMLLGRTSFPDHGVRIGDNIAVAGSGRSESDPTRILLSSKTESTIDAIQSAYNPDIMIFDTSSILVSDNARAFLKNVDCALIITRANNTRYGHFDACEREVAEYTNVLGVVLNAFRTKDIQNHIS